MSPPPPRSPSMSPSPAPSTSSSKKSRHISSNMSDTSLFAELVRGKHFKKKMEEEEDVNGLSKTEKPDRVDEKNILSQENDTSKYFYLVYLLFS